MESTGGVLHLPSMEMGSTFKVPDAQCIPPVLLLYIRDPVPGPLSMCVGSVSAFLRIEVCVNRERPAPE
jgi:hypothetical protein